ncbi:MAG: hypothetical protein EZS28_028562 [Streblomastix strix]|uniref:Uncharacterized protein n=1 Tax=Streblomastix strix TaxID=222440 RepID=A0A5J4UZG7_9EUKA|nr:MAG: hypothetical protein EZS28_028562 [Streblomastix strix]
MVYGPSTSSSLVAFVVPEWDLLLSKDKEKETKSNKWGQGLVKKYWDDIESSSSSKEKQQIKEEKIEIKETEQKKEIKEKINENEEKKEKEKNEDGSNQNEKGPDIVLGPDELEQKRKQEEKEAAEKEAEQKPSKSDSESFTSPWDLRQKLHRDPEVKKFLLEAIKKTAEANPDKVRRFEIPRGIVVSVEEWTDLNGCMTPSFKMKRDFIRNRDKTEFDHELVAIERQDREQLK